MKYNVVLSVNTNVARVKPLRYDISVRTSISYLDKMMRLLILISSR